MNERMCRASFSVCALVFFLFCLIPMSHFQFVIVGFVSQSSAILLVSFHFLMMCAEIVKLMYLLYALDTLN